MTHSNIEVTRSMIITNLNLTTFRELYFETNKLAESVKFVMTLISDFNINIE